MRAGTCASRAQCISGAVLPQNSLYRIARIRTMMICTQQRRKVFRHIIRFLKGGTMGTTVQTSYGKVEGFADGAVNKWFGIPYAKPPVGSLRFKRAVAPDPWSDTKQCTKPSPAPIQFGSGSFSDMQKSATPESEDCLYLNVYAPKDADACPVFVWIYGGANHMGQADLPEYDLTSFAEEGVIGVTFNYRLGPLGFYNFHYLDETFDSNCAISDMITALSWVRDNIEQFGGDPNNVTICGESAGGTAIYSLLSAPSAKGLYQKAIAMSGLGGNITNQITQELNNELFFHEIGISKKDVANLRSASIADIKRAGQVTFGGADNAHPGIYQTGPVIDDLIPDYPLAMLQCGNAKDIPCIIGTCENEGGLFYYTKAAPTSWDSIQRCLDYNGLGTMYETFRKVYASFDSPKDIQAWLTDRMFWSYDTQLALAQAAYQPVYVYRFDFVPAGGKKMGIGASHGMDVGPGLDTYEGSVNQFYVGTPKDDEKKIHAELHSAFVAFAKTGNPNNECLPQWPVFESTQRHTMSINLQPSVLVNPNQERLDAWQGISLYE